MGAFEKATIHKQHLQELVLVVAKYIKAYPQHTGTVAPEVHRGAFDVALKVASAYLSTGQGSEEILRAIDLAVDLLDMAYKYNLECDSEEPIPIVGVRSS